MNLELAFLKSDQRILIVNFDPENANSKLIGFSDLENAAPAALLYTQSAVTDETKEILAPISQLYPVRSVEELSVAPEKFEKLELSEVKEIISKVSSSWTLSNNLSLLQELIKVLNHLKVLWPNDRTTFFEELWSILKNNLHAHDFKVIFNDIERNEGDDDKKEKKKLVRITIEGQRAPSPIPSGELGDKLMEHYQNEFQKNFQVVEYDRNKGEVVLSATINKSPVLMIGKIPQLTQIQLALFQALFDGLQKELA